MHGAIADQLWTIGLCLALTLVVASSIAIYLYIRKRRPPVQKVRDPYLHERITERLAQISTPAPVDSVKTA